MDISGHLLCRPSEIDPARPVGLWWCADVLDVQTVVRNAAAKPSAAQWDSLPREVWDWVEQFPYVFVCVPPGETQREIAAELQKRVTAPILLADQASFRGNKSVCELARNAGQRAVEGLLLGAYELPMPGLLQLADVDMDGPISQNRMMSGILSLDYCLGGFRGGELSVWTGKRGEGKSTWLGQLLNEADNQGKRVCAYSGELPKRQFKRSMLVQAAGPDYVTPVPDQMTGRTEYTVRPEIRERLDRWWRDRLLITDIQQANAHDEDTILRLFEYAYRKYGCDVFLVDNIMTAQLSRERELGLWRAQSAFTQRLSAFAKKNGAHVHLVAHPRKTGERGVSADDVAGTADITNLADNVFSVERVPEERVESEGCSTRVKIIKNRRNGARAVIALQFEETSRRFYEPGENPGKRYTWEAEWNGHG